VRYEARLKRRLLLVACCLTATAKTSKGDVAAAAEDFIQKFERKKKRK